METKCISKLSVVRESYTYHFLGLTQALIAKETPISVTRVAWSPDGNFIGKLPFVHSLILVSLLSQSLLVQGLPIRNILFTCMLSLDLTIFASMLR